ncbi:MAG: translocation/assembly module TamB domain-containing protein [Thermodesulfovibrionales bacterium]|nr:translocation/assembly module TamB domain-containing protein [Thermodesulfovibrionales bacterium]
MKPKKALLIVFILILIALSFVIPKLPFIQEPVKAALLNELKRSTGIEFTIKDISLNILPLFVCAEGINGASENTTIKVKKVKAYLDLTDIVHKEIAINKLVLREISLNGEREEIEKIIRHVEDYLKRDEEKTLKVIVRSVDVEGGNLFIKDKQNILSIEAINTSIKPTKDLKASVFLEGVMLKNELLQDLRFNLRGSLTYKDGIIDIARLLLSVDEAKGSSNVSIKGGINKDFVSSALEIYARILWQDVKKIFGLKNKGDGWIEAKGHLNIDKADDILDRLSVSIDVNGEFFLETLMELLKVKEPLYGYISLSDAKIWGKIRDLEGKGTARLIQGNIFDVKVDSLSTDIVYKKGAMRFTNGKGSIYGGFADVMVMISLPVVNYFEVDVKVKDISSKGLFSLIKWDPKISEGKVSGNLTSKGRLFNPQGHLTYTNHKTGKDILEKIKKIDTDYSMNDNVLTLKNLKIESPLTAVDANAVVDIKKGVLDIEGNGFSSDVVELTAPYFKSVFGRLDFDFSVLGTLKDPMIRMNLLHKNGRLLTGELGIKDVLLSKDIPIKTSSGQIQYKKDRLTIKNLEVSTDIGIFSTKGDVYFKDAKMLFDLKRPYYDLALDVRRLNVNAFSGLFKNSPNMAGIADSRFSLKGKPETITLKGRLLIDDYGYESFKISTPISSYFEYKDRIFTFSNISDNKKSLTGNGSISIDKEFTLTLKTESYNLSELFFDDRPYLKGISLTDLSINARGSIDKPDVDIISKIQMSTKHSRYTIRGNIIGKLKDDVLTVRSNLLDNKLSLYLEADVKDKIKWHLKGDIKTTRYDFFISHFLKEVPDDLVLTLNGNLEMWGDRDKLNARARFNRLYFNIYGNGLSNKGDIAFTINDNHLHIENFILFNDTSEFKVSGNAQIQKRLELTIEGKSSLSPLKAFSTNLDSLKGDADFVVSISGDWKEPKINGGIDIKDGSVGLKDLYYKLTSVNAYIYFDEDRIVISNAKGRMANGDITLSGNAGIRGFKINRFFIETRVVNAHVSPSRDFWINFDGDVILKGDLSSQQLQGEVKVKRGRYAERIDWKTWLISARKIEKKRIESKRFENMNVNLKVTGANLVVDNNLANSTISFDVLLRGKINNIIPIGKVETKEGTVFFRNNEFRIIKANVDFANMEEVKPYFNIVADTKVQNYNIRLTLEGFTDQFNLSLTSDPYLQESDILALLTVGQTGKSLKGLEAGIGASEATSFLTGKLQDVFEERAKTITGFDRIQIDPAISKTTSTVSPRVTVSKKLMGDKLYVTYSASITTGEEQVWKLEYFLDKNFSLIGVRDERGGLGADIKYRFQFK